MIFKARHSSFPSIGGAIPDLFTQEEAAVAISADGEGWSPSGDTELEGEGAVFPISLQNASAFSTLSLPSLVTRSTGDSSALLLERGNNIAASAVATQKGLAETSNENGALSDSTSGAGPTLFVNAADPVDVKFSVFGLGDGYSGTVTFTDAAGKSDVVPITGDGFYSADLSNLADGALTYLMTASNAAGNVINIDPTTTLGSSGYADGAANAPAGTPQLSNLFSGEAVRPPWEVAGVDYAVGVPSGTVLKDPTVVGNLPAGVSIDASGHYLYVTANNVTLNGFDFSVDGGWGIVIASGVSGTTIENCNFAVGSNNVPPIQALPNSSNLTLLNNSFNCGGASNLDPSFADAVFYEGTGTLTVEYNYFYNSYGHMLDFVGGASPVSVTPTVDYNVFYDWGMGAGSHGNPWYMDGNNTITNGQFNFNTIVQGPGVVGGNPALALPSGETGVTITDTTLENNVALETATGGISYIFGGTGTANNTIADNYYDPSGTFGVFYPTATNSTTTVASNVDMVNGTLAASPSGYQTTPPATISTLSSLTESPSDGDLNVGKTVTLTLSFNEVVTVAGGTPTLTLNDGGVATYTGGSGTNALTFSYTVAAGQSTPSLAATAINLNAATITDGAGNAAILSLTGLTQAGPQIDTTAPTISSIAETPSSGDLNVGNAVTLTLTMSGAVTVAGGTPTLTLNDGGTATYTGGSGTNALTFSYTVAAGQSTSALAADAISLNGATIKDAAGNAADLSLASIAQPGPQINFVNLITNGNFETGNFNGWTLAGNDAGSQIYINAQAESGAYAAALGSTGSNGTVSQTIQTAAGEAYKLTFWLANQASGTDNFTATWNGTSLLSLVDAPAQGYSEYTYTVYATGSTSTLEFSALQDPAHWSLDNVSLTPIDPTISSITESPPSGDLDAGKTVTLTLAMSEVVTIAGGTPTLTLNDGGTATYTGGSGTNALSFSYTVAAGQNTSSLAATAINLNAASITDGAGNAADLSLTSLTQAGPQIDTTPPNAPNIASDQIIGDLVVLAGTAESNSTVSIYEGANLLGTTLTNAAGAWVFVTGPQTDGAHVFTATATDAAGNVSALSSPYDPDVGVGPTLSAVLIKVGNQFYIYNSSGAGFTLSLSGSPVTVGEFSGWTPIAATQTASGYYVAWEDTATGQYTVWSTDNNGNYLSNVIGVVAGNSYALESLEAVFNQDLNGDGTIGVASTVIQTDGSTVLSAVANQFAISNTKSDPALTLNGVTVTAGEFPGWTPIGAVQTSTGYDVAWQDTVTGQYTVWATDSNGNYVANIIGVVAANSSALEAIEPIFDQNLNGDGQLTTTTIKTDTGAFGSTSLTKVADQVSSAFYLNNGGGPNVALQLDGADVTGNEFAGWAPIGAVQTATGYDVAWEDSATGQYTVWATDSNGNYLSNIIGVVAGNSYALESMESTFGQDLNGDGTTGLTKTVVQTDGSTSLTQVANEYFLDNSSGSGPVLQLNGADVTGNEFAGWAPIGAVQTATGYDVAWEDTATGQYTVWSTNSSGQYTSNIIGVVAGNSYALESMESTFGQNLNGDGTTGLTKTVIETDGSTSLTQVANEYFLDNSSGSGPVLQLNGADVTAGEFAGWAPIGAVQTATGYDVAWEDTATGQYTVWSTNSSGQYTSNLIGVVAGTSTALEEFEPTFGQDLNDDGVVGLYAAPSTTLQISGALAGAAGAATIGAGATLDLAAADSAAVTFAASTGELVLANPSSFTGEISGFTGNGTLAGSDQIDLKGLSDSGLTDSYSNGVLTVTSGSETVKLDFNGSYALANFSFASDGSGGTIVYDPPVSSTPPQTPASSSQGCGTGQLQIGCPSSGTGQVQELDTFGGQPMLSFGSEHSPIQETSSADSAPDSLALLRSYIASAFPTGDGSSTTQVASSAAWESTHQALLANPHGA